MKEADGVDFSGDLDVFASDVVPVRGKALTKNTSLKWKNAMKIS